MAAVRAAESGAPVVEVETEVPLSAGGEVRPEQYTVASGDALIKIARKFAMTADQLKSYNGLTSDVIRVGQVLKIPTLEQVRTMAPLVPPKAVAAPGPDGAPAAAPTPARLPTYGLQGQEEYVNVLLQVYLDREGFSCGYIDGKSGPLLTKTVDLFLSVREGPTNQAELVETARTVLGNPFTTYELRQEDLHFIMPPSALASGSVSTRRRASAGTRDTPTDPTYAELVAAPLLLYRDAWEMVAERFHCDEGFLRKINPRIKGAPVAGTTFRVPHVFPFEIEHALSGSLQPVALAGEPVSARVVGLTRLEIYKSGELIAVMPVASARPGLIGRQFWTVLDAMPAPRMATLQQPKDEPVAAPPSVMVSAVDASGNVVSAQPVGPAPSRAVLAEEQYLGSGPNNPVGVIWINLARGKGGAEPLPFGLHGTSIPARMKTQEGLGGFRMTNWDIARAVRLLPAGTLLEWVD
jgi:LysM repeat protein